jgi:hypothetical protein
MKTKVQRKLCVSRAGERTRIWLEGALLTDAGFAAGQKFLRTWRGARLILTACSVADFDAAAHGERGTVSGRRDKPIIDLISAEFPTTFAGTHIAVTFGPGRIRIAAD